MWPFVVIGMGYGVVAGGIFLAGALREREIEAGLSGQPFRPLGKRLSGALSVAGFLLTLATLVVIAIGS